MALSTLGQNDKHQDETELQVQKSIQSALARFEAQGITPPKPKEHKASILQRIFSVLNVANPAPYVMAGVEGLSLGGVAERQLKRAWQEGVLGSPWESENSLERKVDTAVFSDVLEELGWAAQDKPSKWTRAIVGLGLDVALDPKTWVTFGTSRAATKLFVPNKGIVGLNKAGKRELARVIAQRGEEAGRKKFAATVASTGNRYLANTGLKFMGKTVIPQKWLNKPIQYADKFLQKIPIEGRVYKAVKAYEQKTLRPAFSYWGDLDTLPKAMKDEARLMEEAAIRGNKGLAQRQFIKLQNMARKATPAADADIPGNLSTFFEAGGKVTGDPIWDTILAEYDRVNSLYHKWYEPAGKKLLGKSFKAPLLGRAGFSETEASLMLKIKDYFYDATEHGLGRNLTKRAYNIFKDELKNAGYKSFESFKKIVPRINAMTPRGELPVYMQHTITKKGLQFLDKDPSAMSEVIHAIKKLPRVKPGFSKQRKLFPLHTVTSINETLRPIMEKAGIKMSKTDGFFEPNIFKNMMMQYEGVATATNSMRFYRQMFDRFVVSRNGLTQAEKMAIDSAKELGLKASFVRDGVTYVPLNMTILGRDMSSRGYVPAQILDHLKKTHNLITGKHDITQGFLKFYDKLLGKWKGDVTGWFPAFHTRNFIGGLWNSWMMGMKDPKRFAQAEEVLKYVRARNAGKTPVDKMLKLGGREVKVSQIAKAMEDSQLIGQAGIMDTMRVIEDKLNFAFNTNKAKSIVHSLGETPQKAMETVENRLRTSLFIDRLAKGEDFKMAARAVYASQFDYAPEFVTAFEKNKLKRIIPFYCVPDESEILTIDGWKHRSEIKKGDTVLTYNLKKDKNEWQQIQDIAVFDFDGELMTLSSKRGTKFTFTKDHRFPVETAYKHRRKIIRAYQLNSTHKIPIAKETILPKDSILTPKESALLGWLVTDGYFRKRGNSVEAMIYQSPKKFADKIRKKFGDWISSESVHPDTGVICFRIKAKYTKNIFRVLKKKSDFPKVVTRLSLPALKELYEAMMDAEGIRNDQKGTSFIQKPGPILDGFQIACNLLGHSFNIVTREVDSKFGKSTMGTGYVRNRKFLQVGSWEKGEEHYKGKIWCPKTPNSTWVMRQNGKVIITGNTWTRHNIPYQIMSLVKTPGKFSIPSKIKSEIEAMEGTRKVKDERKYLPDWLNNMFTIRLPDVKNSGEAYYLQMDLPIEDINRLSTREILSMMSPLLKYPIERIANKSIYFDTPIYDKNVPREYQLSKTIDVFKHLPKPVKDFLGVQEVSWKNYYTGKFEPAVMMDSRKLHFLRSLWTSRFYSFFNKLLDKDSTYPEKFTQLILGEPIRPVDMTEQEWKKTKEYDVMLRDLLYHMLRTKQIPYAGEEEGFEPGTEPPSQSIFAKLGRKF